ncbi:MAG: imidazoleglycerol-phosphate dehydratase HisB [Thermoanaerobaculum sp.]|nr:imidazoleglycerol-phosphate dehydratase HisB [Thermoanaerobaculum sp.]MCX7896086.1 imidazoleglycerol-phosphate dehydratase HisB [Thermoanaerobaculum sp.]MDW7968242.1 imidazoleglycerol-phosphate dehydratase HisB [Thermoanaerobaculum sp.]
MASRLARVERTTGETVVTVELDLSGGGYAISTGVGFFDHMLATFAHHAAVGLMVRAEGDLMVDAHHTVEDVGLALGQAVDEALDTRRGIQRFGSVYAPMDEALARAVVDISGRPFARVEFPPGLELALITSSFPLTLVAEFFRALASRALLTLHLDVERGRDPHHVAEAAFKAFALAFRQAVQIVSEIIPSTKNTLHL